MGGGGVNSLSKIDLKYNTSKDYQLDITKLLDEKYDIQITDYFSLPEKDKNEITDVIILMYKKHFLLDPTLIYLYLDSMDTLIDQTERMEEYEKCDILIRLRKKLKRRISRIKDLM